MQTIYDAKILIVDDNQDLLNLVTTALRSTGYNQLRSGPSGICRQPSGPDDFGHQPAGWGRL